MNLPMANTNLYVQEYRDINLTQSLEKVRHKAKKTKSLRNPNFEQFEAQTDLFLVKIR